MALSLSIDIDAVAGAKFKILNKEPKGREVDEGDSFSFNSEFTAKQIRFKVGTVTAAKETENEKQETRQKVRRHAIRGLSSALTRWLAGRWGDSALAGWLAAPWLAGFSESSFEKHVPPSH